MFDGCSPVFHFPAPVPPDPPSSPSRFTDTSITVDISIPQEANANGPITRFRVIVRGASSNNDTETTYYISSQFQPPEYAPPYFALEQNTLAMRSRRRQSGVGVLIQLWA